MNSSGKNFDRMVLKNCPMMLLLLLVAAGAVWCEPVFARQATVGSASVNAEGQLNGVDMDTTGVGIETLTVGPVFPDIFTSNSSLASLLPAVSVDAASSANILFNNSSTVYGDVGTAGHFFLNITAINGTTVNFLGTVFGTTLNTGTGTVNFNSGTITNSTAMNFTGDGTISLAANTKITGALTTNTDNTGTLILGGGSQLTGAVGGGAADLKAINVVGGSNSAGVSAAIVGAVEAYSYSLGTNTLNINGAMAIDNPGPNSISTTLASSTVYGHIVPTGFTTLPASLGISVLVPSTSYIPLGTQFNIVQATSGTNGSVVAVTIQDPTNPLYTFRPVPLAGTLNGLVTIETTGIPLSTAALPAAIALLAIPQSDILAPINALTDPAQVVNAVAQLSPSAPSLAAPLVTFQGARQFQDLWLSRLDMCRDDSQADQETLACRDSAPRKGWWAKGFGYFGNQDDKGDFTGYTSRILGTMIAYDTPIGMEDTRAGLGIGYARSTIDGKSFDTDMDFDTYQTMAYIGRESGPWFIHGSASFGWNEYSDMRHIVFPGVDRTAKSEYSGQDYTVFAGTGYHFSIKKFTLTPLASLQYSRVNIGDYAETGAGDANLKVNSQGYNFVESALGVQLERSFNFRGLTIIPEKHFRWFHELSNPTLEQSAVFAAPGSASFTTQGLKTSDDTFNVGTGVTLLSCSCSSATWSVEAVYDFDWTNEGYIANQGMVRFTSRF